MRITYHQRKVWRDVLLQEVNFRGKNYRDLAKKRKMEGWHWTDGKHTSLMEIDRH